ncbi:hypothetical protein RUM43_012391 [Polyplax serrata]|uniref:Uncharacterized protein n=1 Tax=Polyplax serrata TaxID=468196 RepID=A0AAN8S384_POLSC
MSSGCAPEIEFFWMRFKFRFIVLTQKFELGINGRQSKPLIKQERPADPPRKPDPGSQKRDGPPTDVRKPEPPKTNVPERPAPAVPEVPKPSLPKDIPKPSVNNSPSLPPKKTPEPPKVTPEKPKPESPKVSPPKVPEVPKVPERPKRPTPPKTSPPKTPTTPPKVPELPKVPPRTESKGSKTPESPRMPDFPKGPRGPDAPGMMPSRRPDAGMPDFPVSGRNPMSSGTNQEFQLPPYLPGGPAKQKPMPGDELFGNFRPQEPTGGKKPLSDLRDLSYSRGELPPDMSENNKKRVEETLSRFSKFIQESDSSDSLEEDDE